jgi:hypothetical protein
MADNLAKRDTKAFDEAVAKAHAIYTPSMLSIYDDGGTWALEPCRLALPNTEAA